MSTSEKAICSVCGTEFAPHFRYQSEERSEPDGAGNVRLRTVHFCSQRCLEASHTEKSQGTVLCSACARPFEVELAAHVLYTGGRRHYCCSTDCRARIRAGVRAVRAGQMQSETYAHAPEAADEELDELLGQADGAAGALPVVSSGAPAATTATVTELPLGRRRTRHEPARVIAVFNHKGGTGKTTTAVNVAAELAARGRQVLLVDTDGQGNVAVSLGLTVQRSLYHVLVMGLELTEAVIPARPRLDVLASNETLAAAELYLAGRRQRDRVLASRLAPAKALYDYVVVDCSPSLSLMNQNALVMADAVLCPVACDYLSLVGVRQVLKTIKNVNRLLSHPVKLAGVLPTQFDARARICHEALDTLREHFGPRCLHPIRVSIRAKEAPAQGKTLSEYAPTASAAEDYRKLVDVLLLDECCGEIQPREAQGGVG
jgi:chromosome partitioning protein